MKKCVALMTLMPSRSSLLLCLLLCTLIPGALELSVCGGRGYVGDSDMKVASEIVIGISSSVCVNWVPLFPKFWGSIVIAWVTGITGIQAGCCGDTGLDEGSGMGGQAWKVPFISLVAGLGAGFSITKGAGGAGWEPGAVGAVCTITWAVYFFI